MGRGRKIILWCGALLMATAGVYPPWLQSWDYGNSAAYKSRFVYGWLFKPPLPPMELVAQAPPAPTAEEDQFIAAMKRGMKWANEPPKRVPQGPQYEPEPGWKTELDVRRLAVEWAILFALIAVCYATWPHPERAEEEDT